MSAYVNLSRMTARIGKTNILCVDDSQNMLSLCKAVLELNGYHVLTEPNGYRALQTLERQNIDGAIIDNEMPGMNGIQLAKAIKRSHPKLPVLMFSGSSPADLRGIDCFVHKTDGPRVLVNALHSLGLQAARMRTAAAGR